MRHRPHPDSYYLSQSFGRLTPLRRDATVPKRQVFVCQCECETIVSVCSYHLHKGMVKSCGCGRRDGIRQRRWRGCGELSGAFWAKIKHGAQTRNIECTVSIGDAWDVLVKQKGRCALSGRTLTFKYKHPSHTASLDRIDSSLGYVPGNIQWVHKDINWMKNRFENEYFIQLCQEITAYQGERANV